MALSGSFQSNTISSVDDRYPRCIIVNWSATQSVSNNTSTISYTIKASGTSSTRYVKAAPIKVEIAGKVVCDRTSRFSLYGGETLESGSLTVSHNNDGTKSISVSISAALYSGSVNSTYSGTITLNTIARASSISSAANITLGNLCSIRWTPASTSFYYKLKFSLGSWSYITSSIHPNTTSSYTYTGYTIPVDVSKQLPNAVSGNMAVYLYTYSNSACTTQIGSVASRTFVVSVPNNISPTLESFEIEMDNSENATVAEWGIYVAGYSKCKLSAIASGSYNSTISSFIISGGYSATQPGKSLSWTGDLLTSSGDVTFGCIAKDSRGRISTTKNQSITVYPYTNPTITSFMVSRKADNSKKMTVKANWNYSSVNNNNSSIATLFYKASFSNSWSKPIEIERNQNTILDEDFEETNSYNFRLVVTDLLSSSAQAETFVSTVDVLMDLRAGGKGLGIGKICETDALEVAFVSKFYNDVYIHKKDNEFITLKEYIYEPLIIDSLNADFNNYSSCGIYTGENISGIANSPAESGNFTLEVLKLGLNSQYLQRLTVKSDNNTKTYERSYFEDIWDNWHCIYSSEKTLLWSGGFYMTEDNKQTINLPKPVSQQATGLELVFAPYINGEIKNYDHSIHWISKERIAARPNGAIGFTMAFGTFDKVCKKILRISDTQITGNNQNTEADTKNGITYDNSSFVLAEVYGV